MDAKELMDTLLETWKTHDDDERRALAEKVFAEVAVHYIAGENLSFTGRDAILENMNRVNKEQIQGGGVVFGFGKTVTNHNGIYQEWDITAPNGEVVRSGRDFYVLNDEGQISAFYMYGGV
ncbi:MAG: hypothetical protein QOI21_6241 [Actinomycetota bacterium]|nr:hypothetical protein [Actinomycetota bacterium]